jgi:hypothetical protein
MTRLSQFSGRPGRDAVPGRSLCSADGRRILGAVLRFRKPPISFVGFLLAIVALGGATGYLVDALGLAAFCFFVASIDAKPSWKFWYDPPAKRNSGRASCAINSYQRVGAMSPKEIRQLPDDSWIGRDRKLRRHH